MKVDLLAIERKFHEYLSLRDIIQECYERITVLSPNFTGISFFNDKHHVSKGTVTDCRHEEVLMTQERPFGTIVFSFKRAFCHEDLLVLAGFIRCLIQPLKNASMYQDALDLAYTDSLTKVYNRHFLNITLQNEIDNYTRSSVPMSIILMDIDRFKRINDTFGHDAGDKVLCRVAEVVKKTIRKSDLLFRYGGEEFVIFLRDANLENARQVAEKIRKNIEGTAITINDDETLFCTSSFGVSQYSPTQTLNDLFKKTDEALYRSKASGRNTVTVANCRDGEILNVKARLLHNLCFPIVEACA